MPTPTFTPTADVRAIINHLLNIFERRGGAPKQTVRVTLTDIPAELPGYFSQTDPAPRAAANEQLQSLAAQNALRLTWQPGQKNHLLAQVALNPAAVEALYALVGRQPEAAQRQALRDLLLGNRFQLSGWRLRAVEHTLTQLKTRKSPSPFRLTDPDWNQDLLTALIALPDDSIPHETPYRVFSVRLFNDSKRFETLKDAIARLARRHNPAWRDLSPAETLHELGLVPNPGHLYLFGAWQIATAAGQLLSLDGFAPSVGIPAALAAETPRVTVSAWRVVCVENLTSFYELIRHGDDDFAALCLWGNPSPAARHLLAQLVQTLPADVPLQVWADMDYGGLNILSQLRRKISPRFSPWQMDIATLDEFARWGQPLTDTDRRNLARLRANPMLADMRPLIDHILRRNIKLEQEAIAF